MSIKTRSLNKKIHFPTVFSGPDGTVDLKKGNDVTWTGRQYTVSEGHRKGHDGQYHEGGPFYTYRTEVDLSSPSVNMLNEKFGNKIHYSGPITCGGVPQNAASAVNPRSNLNDLDPLGATAVARSNPLNPNANTGVALGEILTQRSLPLPGISTWKKRTEIARAAGSEYLSAVFGWLPLVKDVKDTSQSILDGNEIMSNHAQLAGSSVRRGFVFDPIVTYTETNLGPTQPTCGGWLDSDLLIPTDVTVQTTTTKKRWFSGAFTYHFPSQISSFKRCLGIGTEAEKLFGLALNPEVLWELTPWSWAADWFSNAGDVISNINAMKLAGLVMRYGYIMEEYESISHYSQKGRYFYQKGKVRDVPLTASVISITKRRQPANPFGFGISWEGLSPSQLAITAALGITRLR
jgi:hypothetical protein